MQPDLHRHKHEVGVFATLIEEHRRIAELFDVIEGLPPESREAATTVLARELLAHTRAEQAIIYRRLDGSHELEHEMTRANGQHLRIEQLVDDLRELDPDETAWARKVEELRRAVEQHVEEEEREVIPRAHLVLDDISLTDLQIYYRAEKQQELAKLERSSGHAE